MDNLKKSTATAIGAASVISLSIVLYYIFKRRSQSIKKTKECLNNYDSDKPQMLFKKYIQNNHKDNINDFLPPQHSEKIKSIIANLPHENILYLLKDYELTKFLRDSYEYIDEEHQLKAMAAEILEKEKIIGIDIEQTNTNTYQGYNCLIQISSTKKDYIIDAIMLHDILPEYLRLIFENPSIVKVFYSGVSDLLWLKRDCGIFVVNYFDVFYAAVALEKGNDSSLTGLLLQYCNEHVDKKAKKQFQISDWRRRPLSQEQLNYAAMDSHYLIYLRNELLEKLIETKGEAGATMFIQNLQKYCLKPYEVKNFSVDAYATFFDQEWNTLKKQAKKNENFDLQKYSGNLLRNRFLALCNLTDKIARDIDTDLESICDKKFLFGLVTASTVDLPQMIMNSENQKVLKYFPGYIKEIEQILKDENIINYAEKPTAKNTSKASEKLQRRLEIEKQRKTKELYENCKIISPNGELLSYTHRAKVKWYLQKGLATMIQEEPPVIQLKFQPSGKKPEILEITGGSYENSKQGRVNRCAVCGQNDRLSRYHIIPLNYRQHFPIEMKHRRAIDVILLCERCLEKANKEAHKFKLEIAKKYDVPLLEFKDIHQLQVLYGTIRKAVSSIKKHGDLIPLKNQANMKREIQMCFLKIKDNDNITENIKNGFQGLGYQEDGNVLVDQQFMDLFTTIKNFNEFVKETPSDTNKNMHGKLVLEQLKTKEEIQNFIHDWRVYFVTSMDPQFLPEDLNIILSQKAS